MRAGVIDIGSSSIKVIIGEAQDDQIKILEFIKNILPIGKNAFLKGRISQEVINQTISLLQNYKQLFKEYDVSKVQVIATTAVREASNQGIFLDTIYRKTGFKIEVLNVGDVVYYIDTFLSLKLNKTYPIYEKNLLVAELGAGSLDISVMEKGATVMNLGIPIGTLRINQFKNKIDGSSDEIYEALAEYIENEIMYIKKTTPLSEINDIILIDENYSPYLRNIFANKGLDTNFFQFKRRDAAALLKRVTKQNLDDLASSFSIPKEIVETLDGYAIVLNALYKLASKQYLYILETSLPEALLANLIFDFELSKKDNKKKQLVSVVNMFCKKYDVDLKHVKQVADLSETLFQDLKGILGLVDNDLTYLLLAAYLHDVGMFINNRAHHKHSEYIISSCNFFRLTEEEIKIIACVARYHRRTAPAKTHLVYSSLPPDKQILVQKLSALIRIANALDRSHKQKVKELKVEVSPKQEVNLVVHTSGNFILEKINFGEKKDMFEEVSGSKINLTIKD